MSAMKGKQEVEAALKSYEDVDSWKTVIFLYNAALKEVGTKLEILNDEFQHVHQYNPIEHIKTRIKTPESIVKKLKRYGYETSIENMVRYINDIAGVRLICSFTSDIYRLAEMIVLVKILLIQFILPAVVTLLISEFMRKKKWIRFGDMKLD